MLKNHVCDAQALLLAAGNLEVLMTETGVVAIGETEDFLVYVGELACRFDLGVRGHGDRRLDGAHDRFTDGQGLLRHVLDAAAVRFQPHVANVLAVDVDDTVGDIHGPGEQLQKRGFASARLADDGDDGSTGKVETNVVKDGLPTLAAKSDMVEGDVARRESQGSRTPPVNGGPGVLDPVHEPLCRGQIIGKLHAVDGKIFCVAAEILPGQKKHDEAANSRIQGLNSQHGEDSTTNEAQHENDEVEVVEERAVPVLGVMVASLAAVVVVDEIPLGSTMGLDCTEVGLSGAVEGDGDGDENHEALEGIKDDRQQNGGNSQLEEQRRRREVQLRKVGEDIRGRRRSDVVVGILVLIKDARRDGEVTLDPLPSALVGLVILHAANLVDAMADDEDEAEQEKVRPGPDVENLHGGIHDLANEANRQQGEDGHGETMNLRATRTKAPASGGNKLGSREDNIEKFLKRVSCGLEKFRPWHGSRVSHEHTEQRTR